MMYDMYVFITETSTTDNKMWPLNRNSGNSSLEHMVKYREEETRYIPPL